MDSRGVYINTTEKVPSIQVASYTESGDINLDTQYEILRVELKNKGKVTVVAKLVYGNTGGLVQRNGVAPASETKKPVSKAALASNKKGVVGMMGDVQEVIEG